MAKSKSREHFVARIAILLGSGSARSGRPLSASAGDSRPARGSRRRPFGGGRIRTRQAPTADPQSIPKTVPQSPSLRSGGRQPVDGVALCQMFNRAIGRQPAPTYLSSDHDPLYRFHQWQANLRILDVKAIKTVPYVPLSHPFVERLIGTIRRECLDHTLFWTATDLENKLLDFQRYFNGHSAHAGLGRRTPKLRTGEDRARA